jgi:hypothetical protein
VTPSPYAATARAAAREILSRPPFRTTPQPPGAVQRALDAIGHAVVSALRFLGHLFGHDLGHPVGHGVSAVFGGFGDVVVVVFVVLLAVGGAVLYLRRSRPGREAPTAASPSARRAARLYDGAAAARREGDYDRALRLRFEAGLERLEARGVLEGRRTLTTGEVRSRLRSSSFDGLAATHERVAYGGAPATSDDVRDAFDRWPEVERDGARQGAA